MLAVLLLSMGCITVCMPGGNRINYEASGFACEQ
jgi:hypothetical protein